jgi:hypothetical protein
MLVVNVFDRKENFANSLKKFGFAGMLSSQLLHDKIRLHNNSDG